VIVIVRRLSARETLEPIGHSADTATDEPVEQNGAPRDALPLRAT